MGKINIIEQDLSRDTTAVSVDNIAYIPGYSVMGPVNTPTLCLSYNEFTQTFGSSPFVYKEDQIVNSTIVAKKDEFEKSWIYAAQLLRSGLPVLFERVSSEENDTSEDGNTAKGKLQFNTLVGGKIVVGDSSYFVGGEDLYSDESLETMISALEFEYTLEETTVTVDFKNIIKTASVYDTNKVQVLGEVFEINIAESSGSLEFEYSVGQTQVKVGSENDSVSFTIVDQDQVVDENNYYTISAKSQGSYGNDIKIKISDDSTSVSRLFKLIISDSSKSESYTVSFDKVSKKSDYITTALSTSKIVNIIDSTSENFNVSLDSVMTVVTGDNNDITISGGVDQSYEDVLTTLRESEALAERISDKFLYDISFITSGGYPSLFEDEDIEDSVFSLIGRRMLDAAGSRGEALALIDFVSSVKPEDCLGIVKNVFTQNATTDKGESLNSFGAIFNPSVKVYCSTVQQDVVMPGSFAYLSALANSIRNNPIWFAASGVRRGAVPNFKESVHAISQVRLSEWQDGKQSINPILEVRPSGNCIFGNRTLQYNEDLENLSALAFLNVRVMFNFMKKVIRQVCLRQTYENNDNVQWNKFKSDLSPVLDQMKTGRGLLDYKILRVSTDKKATVAGIVRVQPIEAIESFDISFSIEDSNITIE